MSKSRLISFCLNSCPSAHSAFGGILFKIFKMINCHVIEGSKFETTPYLTSWFFLVGNISMPIGITFPTRATSAFIAALIICTYWPISARVRFFVAFVYIIAYCPVLKSIPGAKKYRGCTIKSMFTILCPTAVATVNIVNNSLTNR